MMAPYRSLLPRGLYEYSQILLSESRKQEDERGGLERAMRIRSFVLLMVAYGNPVRIIYKENLWLWRRNAKQKQAATPFKYR
jgi:hypothetical protein